MAGGSGFNKKGIVTRYTRQCRPCIPANNAFVRESIGEPFWAPLKPLKIQMIS